jgi:hypothetical protein
VAVGVVHVKDKAGGLVASARHAHPTEEVGVVADHDWLYLASSLGEMRGGVEEVHGHEQAWFQ